MSIIGLVIGDILCIPFVILLLLRWTRWDDVWQYQVWVHMYFAYFFILAWPLFISAVCVFLWRVPSTPTESHWTLSFLILSAIPFLYHVCLVIPIEAQRCLPPNPLANKLHLSRKVIRVFSSNLLMVNGHSDDLNRGIVSEVIRSDPDVILLQEYSPRWAHMFEEHVFSRYPYRSFKIERHSFGCAILSKFKFEETCVDGNGNGNEDGLWWIGEIPFVRKVVRVPMPDGTETRVKMIGVHTLPPNFGYTPLMKMELAEIKREIKRDRSSPDTVSMPVVIMGDFNMSPFNVWIRQFGRLADMRNCHDECNRAYRFTFPNGIFPVPPLRIDHAFISTDLLRCHGIREGTGLGSDHLPLIADIGIK